MRIQAMAAAGFAAAALWTNGAAAATFEWVNGQVTSITAQLPAYTTAMVNGMPLRFCDPKSGEDFPVTADNLHYNLLKSARDNGKSVQVGVMNFGSDARVGSIKRCIERVIY